jgi:hypothetical protein
MKEIDFFFNYIAILKKKKNSILDFAGSME